MTVKQFSLSFYWSTLFIGLVFFTGSSSALAQVSVFTELLDSTFTMETGVPELKERKGALNRDIAFNERKLKSSQATNNQRLIFLHSGILGTEYLKKNEFNKARDKFKIALAACQVLKNKRQQAVILSQIAFSWFKQREYKIALENFNASLALMEQEAMTNARAPVSVIAAQCAIPLKQSELAFGYLQQSLKAYLKLNDQKGIATVYNLIGQLQLVGDEYANSLMSFQKAKEILLKLKDNTRLAITERNIGLVYFKKGQLEKAISNFEQSIKYDKQLLVSKLMKEAYMKLFTVHSFNKSFDKADYYHERYRALKDSLQEIKPNSNAGLHDDEMQEKENIIRMLERKTQEQQLVLNQKGLELSAQITATDIERQNKENALEQLQHSSEEIERLAKETAIKERNLARKELQLSSSKSFRNMLLLIALALVIFAYFIYNRYRIKKTANEKLELTNTELAHTLEQLKRTQEQLIQSEKLASLGQLTAGIAHEIKNPLNFVNNFSALSIDLLDEIKESKSEEERLVLIRDVEQNLRKISEHGKRADSIVKNMLMHTRSGEQQRTNTNINTLLQESYEFAYQSFLAKDKTLSIKTDFRLADHLPEIPVVQQEISRVVINLLDNAFYALRKKKSSAPPYNPELKISSQLELTHVVVSISDNATGMDKETLKKIFHPFFTTKPTGEGTGLGLSMCYDIITKGHKGKIEVESTVGNGTTFHLKFPISKS